MFVNFYLEPGCCHPADSDWSVRIGNKSKTKVGGTAGE